MQYFFTTPNGYNYIYISKKQYLLLISDISMWILKNAFYNGVIYNELCYSSPMLNKYSKDEIEFNLLYIQFLNNSGLLGKEDSSMAYSPMHIMPWQVRDNFASANDVVLEVTEKCNLACRYCIYGDLYNYNKSRGYASMTFKTAKKIIDHKIQLWLSNYNNSTQITKMIGFYGGEPLLNIALIKQVVAYIHSREKLYDLKFRFNITTNATLLHKYIDFLVENNFIITISLDGNAYHNQYRVLKNNLQSFDIILQNINIIRKKYPDYFRDNISFNTVLHNKSEIAEVYQFFRKSYDKQPIINTLSPYTDNPNLNTYFYRGKQYRGSHNHNYYLKNDDSKLFE